MTLSEVNKRLKRLSEAGVCNCENDIQSADELKKLAMKIISQDNAKAKSKFFRALADTIRLRILGLLAVREMCVCEVMVALNLTQPTASHHLRILENVGLIKDRREGKWIFYALNDPTKIEKLLDV